MTQLEDLFYLESTKQLISVNRSDEETALVTTTQSSPPASVFVLSKLPPQLSSKVFIIDSIKSGTGRTGKNSLYENVLKPILDLLKVDYEYVSTTSRTSISEFASRLSIAEATVLFISGDTSINEFVNGLSETSSGKLTLLPIPLGTGNSLALSLDISNDLDAIRKLFTTSTASPLNLYQVDFPKGSFYQIQDSEVPLPHTPLKFIVVLSWGFHASLVADSDTPEFRKFGIERFKMAAFDNLKSEQKYEGEFTIKNGDKQEVIPGPFAYWLLTPARKFEPKFEISPKGNIFDNNLYLVSFNTEDDPTSGYIMEIMGQAYNEGSHVNNEKVVYKKLESGAQLKLSTSKAESRGRRFCLDGSIVVLPDSENELFIRSTGSKHNGWNIEVLH